MRSDHKSSTRRCRSGGGSKRATSTLRHTPSAREWRARFRRASGDVGSFPLPRSRQDPSWVRADRRSAGLRPSGGVAGRDRSSTDETGTICDTDGAASSVMKNSPPVSLSVLAGPTDNRIAQRRTCHFTPFNNIVVRDWLNQWLTSTRVARVR